MSYRAFDGYSSFQNTNGVDGYNLSIRAQFANGTNSIAGDLLLGSGSGVARDGYLKLYSGINEVVRITQRKFSFLLGQRIKVDIINTTPFNITDGYYALLVDTSGGAKTINLPIGPAIGDTYNVKDLTGNSAANNITVSGNGVNVDGNPSYTINTNYASSVFVFNGSTWSVL